MKLASYIITRAKVTGRDDQISHSRCCIAKGDAKESYFMLAEQWDVLATRLEANIRSG